MKIDKTTLSDLSIFHHQEEYSLFHKIDFTTTSEGKSVLQSTLKNPLKTIDEINAVQSILSLISKNIHQWPTMISNGTILVIEKFFNDNPDPIPEEITEIQAVFYKWLHPRDYALILFSMRQIFYLVKGFQHIHDFFQNQKLPNPLSTLTEKTKSIIADKRLVSLLEKKEFHELSRKEILYYGRIFHVEIILETRQLIQFYGQLDAWYAMAKANLELNLQNPTFIKGSTSIEAKSVRHLLLEKPVGYDIIMNHESNFIFLTGANMAGKSTMIKALGLSVYMAHLGMGVPASEMRLSLFEGIVSNINIEDNISKGESYFFNEVKRIKETIQKITDGSNWLVLIDELFKGTNIQDAMKCSSEVIRGLIHLKHCLFVLSTHLYEIGEDLQDLKTIDFKYFEKIGRAHV